MDSKFEWNADESDDESDNSENYEDEYGETDSSDEEVNVRLILSLS